MSATEKKGRSARRKVGLVRLLLVIAAAAALIGVNLAATVLEKKNGWRADWSFNAITTASEKTAEILKGLKDPVHIRALYTRGNEDAALTALLDRYAATSPMVTWEQVDPRLNPSLVARFSTTGEAVSSDSLIVSCENTGRWRILSPADFVSLGMDEETGVFSYTGYRYESALTGAIEYVTRERIPKVMIVQGHGELDGETLTHFTGLLEANHYEVGWTDLTEEPDPADLLVFFSPQRDLNDQEMEKVLAFARKGGSLLFTADVFDPLNRMPNFTSLQRLYGFEAKEGIVVAGKEEPDSYYNDMQVLLIPEMQGTDITMDLIASGADTLLLPGSRAFVTPEESGRNLIVSPVLQSGRASWLKPLTGNDITAEELQSLEKENGDETGPFTLALQARRVTEQGNISRAFIIGCAATLTEEQIYIMTDAQQLIIRMMEFLQDVDATDLNIMARTAVRPGLSARGNQTGAVLVTALPLAVLVIALAVLVPRRNR